MIDSGAGPVAIVALDLIHILDMMPLRQRIQRELGVAADHVMITASHDHSGPRLWGGGIFVKDAPPRPEEDAFMVATYQKVIDALRTAKASMQPARMGFGTGAVDVNVNRDEYKPGRGWVPGFNPTAPSDKTVWVAKFETLTGEPIAVWFNYAVHSIVTFNLHVISGDLAGAAERVVEERYNNKAVALFTMGAAGNQHPKYIGAGDAIGAGGGGTRDLAELRRQAYPAMDAQGWMLGSEVLRVARQIQARTTSPRIAAAESDFVCPSKPDKYIEGGDNGTQLDRTAGQPIRVGVIRFDQTALAWVSAEIVYNINAHLKAVSPLANTIMVTMGNGRSGYIPDDASYDTPNFETGATNVLRGCAENRIVNGLVDLIQQTSPR
jgi:hypothetical protein